jgi:hypothetical protein
MRSIHTAVLKPETLEPPTSEFASAAHSGLAYHFVEAANGLSTWPLLVVVVELLLDDELELEDDELEELLDEDDELLELLEDEELELDEDELLEDEELELEELLLDEDELLEELLEELLDEDELLLDELELLEPPIEPAETVRVTLSSRAPSSRLTIRSVCAPAARLLKVAGVIVP